MRNDHAPRLAMAATLFSSLFNLLGLIGNVAVAAYGVAANFALVACVFVLASELAELFNSDNSAELFTLLISWRFSADRNSR